MGCWALGEAMTESGWAWGCRNYGKRRQVRREGRKQGASDSVEGLHVRRGGRRGPSPRVPWARRPRSPLAGPALCSAPRPTRRERKEGPLATTPRPFPLLVPPPRAWVLTLIGSLFSRGRDFSVGGACPRAFHLALPALTLDLGGG